MKFTSPEQRAREERNRMWIARFALGIAVVVVLTVTSAANVALIRWVARPAPCVCR